VNWLAPIISRLTSYFPSFRFGMLETAMPVDTAPVADRPSPAVAKQADAASAPSRNFRRFTFPMSYS
jgi:hypothetical protein